MNCRKLLTKDHTKRPSASEIMFDPLMIQIMKKAVLTSNNLRKQFEISLSTGKKPLLVAEAPVSTDKIKSQEKLIIQKMKQLERDTREKLKKLASQIQDTNEMTLFENEILKNIQALHKAVATGFKKIRDSKSTETPTKQSQVNTNNSSNRLKKSLEKSLQIEKTIQSQLSDMTINSVMLGQSHSQTAKSKNKSQLNDETIRSIEMSHDSRVMGDTILSNNMGQSKSSFKKPTGNDSELGDTLRSEMMQTMKKSNLSKLESGGGSIMELGLQTMRSESFSGTITMKTLKGLNQKTLNNLIGLSEKMTEVKDLAHQVIEHPELLLDDDLLSYTLSDGQASFKNTLFKKTNFELNLTKNSVTIKPNEKHQPSEKHEQGEDEYADDFEEYEEEKKNYKTFSSGIDRNKEMEDIMQIYRSQLLQIEKQPQHNKYLVMSEIKEMSNENSQVSSKVDFQSQNNSSMRRP